jgi:hypothetical protein
VGHSPASRLPFRAPSLVLPLDLSRNRALPASNDAPSSRLLRKCPRSVKHPASLRSALRFFTLSTVCSTFDFLEFYPETTSRVRVPGWRPQPQLSRTDPPPVERRALAFDSTSSHRPSCPCRRGGRCRVFVPPTGRPVGGPLSPFHADPVARAIGPGANRNRPHGGQLGWPQIRRLRTTAPLPTVAREPGRIADPLGRPSVPTGHPLPTVARGPGATRRRPTVTCGPTPTPRCRRLPVDPVGGGR